MMSDSLSVGPEVEIYTALVEKDESINLTRQALPVAGADTVADSCRN